MDRLSDAVSPFLVPVGAYSNISVAVGSTKIDAHRSGCHRWHSCPSDRGTYLCGDTGYCNYCPGNQYCKAGKPKAASATKEKINKQQPLPTSTLTGKVVKVVDGDTLYVLDANFEQHKIRLAGIDAPERKQAYGFASRKHLASIVAGKQVTVEYQKRDRYGRIVGKVLLDGIDVCLEQVKARLPGATRNTNMNRVQRTSHGPLDSKLHIVMH